MSSFKENIAALRKNAGLSQSNLAKQVGVRKTTISNYETGYSVPDYRILSSLADIFSVSIDSLLGHQTPSQASEPIIPISFFPIVGEVHAGAPYFAIEEVMGYLPLPKDMVGGYDYFGLVVKGDSMNLARIEPNDILLVRRQNTADNGDIVIAFIDGEEATVKRYFRNGDTVMLYPNSTNPNHLPIQIKLNENKNFTIMGKVMRAIINL